MRDFFGETKEMTATLAADRMINLEERKAVKTS
jgi:hypothetical protein